MARRVRFLLLVGVVLAGVLVVARPWAPRLPDSFCPESLDSQKTAPRSALDARSVPYAGSGPHRLAVYEILTKDAVGRLQFAAANPSQEDLPKAWYSKYDDDRAVNAQLLLCVYDEKYREEAGQTIGRCKYTDHSRADTEV